MISKQAIKSFGANLLSSTGVLDFLLNKEPSWRILMYHRVCNPESLLYPIQAGMYVRPETFQMHCKYLSLNTNVIPVDELIEKLINKEPLPKRTVAITFDDGWKDNLDNAFPILKAHNLPATIFLPTEFIDTKKLFWTDEIARALYMTPLAFAHHPEFSRFKEQPLMEQLESILNLLFSFPTDKRQPIIKHLTQNLLPHDQREFLTWREVSTLDTFGVRIGSHSHSHRLFKELSKEERQREFEQSRDILKTKALLTSRVFVFPGGSHTLEMGDECLSSGYLASLRTSSNFSSSSLVFPRVGIHEDISRTEGLLKYRLALV